MGIAGWVFLAVVVLLLLYVVGVYNRLVRLRALVREGFSGITVQLRRRAEPDQPVVHADHVQKQKYDDRQEDPARNAHLITP